VRRLRLTVFRWGLVPLFGSATVLAQDTAQFDMVWEREFLEEIRDVAFAETRDGRLFLKAVVLEDEVTFYDEDGSVAAIVRVDRGDKVVLADHGDYVGVETREDIGEGWGRLVFAVYTDRGALLWDRSEAFELEPPDYDWIVSSRGWAAVPEEVSGGEIRLLDSYGADRRALDLLRDSRPGTARNLRCVFSDHGRTLAVTVDLYAQGGVRWGPHAGVFGVDGAELWWHALEIPTPFTISGLAISRRGARTLVTGYQPGGVAPTEPRAWLFGANGAPIGHVDIVARVIAFSRNERFVALSCWEQEPSVLLLETNAGDILWRVELEPDDGSLTGLQVSDDGDVLMALAPARHFPRTGRQLSTDPTIRLLRASDGTVAFEKRFAPSRLPWKGVALSRDGTSIGAATTRTIEIRDVRD
jgi:hypothetical protein